MKKFNADLRYLILLCGLLIGSLILTWAHHGNVIVDCGREAYYPTQILTGKVLYKDIFNIYGPFAYQFNALLFKIFGIHLNVLYAAGCISSFLIVNLIYLIAKRFMSAFLAFSVSLFTIATGVFSLNLFNFVFPYSYGMLYGLVFVLTSLCLLLKYNELAEIKYLYLSNFFAGLAIVSKYDFFLYSLVLIYAAFIVKKLNFKEYLSAFLSFIFAPVVCFSILFYQGLTLHNLAQSFGFMHKMLQANTLKYFYRHKGVFPSWAILLMSLQAFIKTIIPILFIIGAFFAKNRFIYFLLIFVALILEYASVDGSSYIFVPIWIVLWSVFNYKFLKNNINISLLLIATILVSTKEFWGLILYTYGIFSAPLLMVTVLAIISAKNKDKNRYGSQFVPALYFIVAAFIFALMGLPLRDVKSSIIQTDRGMIYSSEEWAKPSNKLLDYLQKNTDKSDTIAIFPEGLMFNFLTDRKSDNYYSSLIPLYVEMFGEENIIEHFKKTKPDYIIFNNYDTSDYYLKQICVDYAVTFCEYVVDNYKKVLVIEDGLVYNIFRKN